MERVKKKMEDARKQRDTMPHNHSQTTDELCDKKSKSILSRNIKLLTLHENSFCFLLGMAVVLAAVIVVWRMMLEKWPENNPASSPVEIAAYQEGGSTEMQVLASENIKLREDIAYLNERLTRLTNSAAHLENKPAPSTWKKQSRTPETKLEAEEPHPAKSTGTGAWVINLVSLPSQADADQFSARARSKGVHTEQQNVTVKGKKYWRVQIIGFFSSEEAKSHSNSAKQKLGLKDVWIMKR